ncbi:DUF3558 domain-containing protein [Nocardia farcinica]|uniref:DUF3558 domain-containing protein n=1 Tax=Nocardia farcinica TaxID=37329 RepID=UPI0018932CD4|nr:DUF3558 domain-containing protein [Nocardia farcinica]MBF6293488.1 DUF3558 domain-containing protein [Nocardia farcinica]MBF6380128.1 DUF3558 domain-containing protein [Nocardia farcinica]
MRTTIAARAMITGAAVLALTTGCGTEIGGQTTSAAPTTPAMDNLLNPCTDIPDEWLIETGLDPSTERDLVNPTEASAWRNCGWNSADQPYRMDLMSSSRTLDETRNSTSVNILGDTTVGARPALLTRVKSDTTNGTCYVTFPAQQGSFTVTVGWLRSDPPQNICDIAVEHATDLEAHLPK